MYAKNGFFVAPSIPNITKHFTQLILIVAGFLGFFFSLSDASAAEPPSRDGVTLFDLRGENLNAKIQKMHLDFDMSSFADGPTDKHLIKATGFYQIEAEEATEFEVFSNILWMSNGVIKVNGSEIGGEKVQVDIDLNWASDKQRGKPYRNGYTRSIWGNDLTLSLQKGTNVIEVELDGDTF